MGGVTAHVLYLIDHGAKREARASMSFTNNYFSCIALQLLIQNYSRVDCEVARKSNYMGGVTAHVLNLIDHGAKCEAHASMSFTNNGCHCKQQWRAPSGKMMKFPDNCA